MPENTDHPTQKPEKLIAKLVLASSPEGSLVFDPFLGSGTTAVVCKKLNRRYLGIEQNPEYCCWAQKRLNRAASDPLIQSYADGVFWELGNETVSVIKNAKRHSRRLPCNSRVQLLRSCEYDILEEDQPLLNSNPKDHSNDIL